MAEQYTKAVSTSAEKRMRQWAIEMEVKDRVEHEHAGPHFARQVFLHPYIAISRDTGAGASELARRVSERLGWDLLNREVLDFMAEKYHLDKSMVALVDETASSWIMEVFGKWMSQRVVTNTEYTNRLGKVLLIVARRRSTVFVGRGAQFFLPRERGLAVRLIAPLEKRLERVMQREKLSLEDARRYLSKKDRERRDFVREHFGRDVTDPHLYDLVINSEYMTIDWAVDLIVSTCQRRFQLG